MDNALKWYAVYTLAVWKRPPNVFLPASITTVIIRYWTRRSRALRFRRQARRGARREIETLSWWLLTIGKWQKRRVEPGSWQIRVKNFSPLFNIEYIIMRRSRSMTPSLMGLKGRSCEKELKFQLNWFTMNRSFLLVLFLTLWVQLSCTKEEYSIEWIRCSNRNCYWQETGSPIPNVVISDGYSTTLTTENGFIFWKVIPMPDTYFILYRKNMKFHSKVVLLVFIPK